MFFYPQTNEMPLKITESSDLKNFDVCFLGAFLGRLSRGSDRVWSSFVAISSSF